MSRGAPSEGSDQPALLHVLIRVFAVRLKMLCICSYPQSALRRLLSEDCAAAQADPSLRWAYMQSGVPRLLFNSKDIVPLFTNTPIDKTLEVICSRLEKDIKIKNKTRLLALDILELLKFVLTTYNLVLVQWKNRSANV